MEFSTERRDETEQRIALLEAQLEEIRVARDEMRRELVHRAYLPHRTRLGLIPRLALVASLSALGMAAWGIGAVMAPEPEATSPIEGLSDIAPPSDKGPADAPQLAHTGGQGTQRGPAGGVRAAPEPRVATDKPPASSVRVDRKPTWVRPPRKPEKPSIIDTFAKCGDDPLCGGID